MRTCDYLDSIYQAINDARRISRLAISKEDLKKFLQTLDAINSLERHAIRFNDELISDYCFPQVFEGFLAPNSVTVTGKDEDVDYLFREQPLKDVELMSRIDMINFTNQLNATFKMNEIGVIRRESKTLGSICSQSIIYDDVVASISESVVPIQLTIKVKQDYAYSESVSTYVKRLIASYFNNFVSSRS